MAQAGDKFLVEMTMIRQIGDEHPEHPIELPKPPSWGDYYPAHPIVIPPILPGNGDHPEHPIVLPPPPGDGKPPLPPYYPAHPIILPGIPTHPIVIPPPGDKPPSPAGDWGWVYVPGQGWVQAWFPNLIPAPSV